MSKQSDPKNPKGYIVVRPIQNGFFKLYLEYRQENKKITKYIPQKLWLNYGFQSGITVEKAKELAKQLNKERHDLRKEVNAAKRFDEISKDERFFPEALARVFWEEFIGDNRGSEEHKKKLHSQFHTIQELIKELKVYPDQYKLKERKLITLFIQKKYSVNYAKNLIKMINNWGDFYSKQFNRRYEVVKLTSNFDKAALSKAQMKKIGKDSVRGVRIESKPLTPDHLKKVKDKFEKDELNWLALSIWMGLRPSEIDGFVDPATWMIEESGGIPILCIYQSKLVTLPEEKKWKKIPCFLKEQQDLISTIEAVEFKKPSYKKMRIIFKGLITHYGGRKGFTTLMRDFGQDYIDISAWLGHQTTEMTYKHYTDKQEIRWTAVIKKAG